MIFSFFTKNYLCFLNSFSSSNLNQSIENKINWMQQSVFKIKYDNDSNCRDIHLIIGLNGLQKQEIKFGCINGNPILTKRNVHCEKNQRIKQIIHSQKIKKIGKNFIKKLRYNSALRQPPQNQNSQQMEQRSDKTCSFFTTNYRRILKTEGIKLTNFCFILWNLIIFLQAYSILIILTILSAFQEANNNSAMKSIRQANIVLNIADILLNLLAKRYVNGRYLLNLQQIIQNYIQSRLLFIDLSNVFLLLIYELLETNTVFSTIIIVSSIIKFFVSCQNLQKVEFLLLNCSCKQHYFSLFKCIFTNFTIGHFISIILNLMTFLNHQQNWYYKIGIENSQWFKKYVWGYYWGTNIMLTVGFGDISATNQLQALVIVIVETFSCITLAYNINCVGTLISSIKKEEEEKKRKLKFFHRMCEENCIQNNTEAKISNYIQEEYRIKQLYEQDEHNQILQSLPERLENQFKKESNKNLFKNLESPSLFLTKILQSLAGSLLKRICHPEELIITKSTAEDFIILQKGGLNFICDNNSKLDGLKIQRLQIKQGEKPKIISFNFIRNKIPNFNVKSEGYSTIFTIKREKAFEVLRNFQRNYELLCQLKDKDQNDPEENNLYPCSLCKNDFHTKFECNRLHYVPLKRKVIFKYISEVKQSKQSRQKIQNRQQTRFKTIRDKKKMQKAQNSSLLTSIDSNQYIQIKKLEKFYEDFDSIKEASRSSKENIKKQMNQILKETRSKDFKLNNIISEYSVLKKFEQMIQLTKLAEKEQTNIEADLAYNYRIYFRQWNPERIGKKKSRLSFLCSLSDKKKQKIRKE